MSDEHKRVVSVTLGARIVADIAAVAVLEADFRRTKEETERSRRESRRVEEGNRDTTSKLEQETRATRESERTRSGCQHGNICC